MRIVHCCVRLEKQCIDMQFRTVGVAEAGRWDILISLRDGRRIVIENKIWAREQALQVERYQRSLRASGGDSCVVFLTPDRRAPTSGSRDHTKLLSYADLATVVRRCARGVEPHGLGTILKQYGAICDEIGGNAIGESMAAFDPEIERFVT